MLLWIFIGVVYGPDAGYIEKVNYFEKSFPTPIGPVAFSAIAVNTLLCKLVASIKVLDKAGILRQLVSVSANIVAIYSLE